MTASEGVHGVLRIGTAGTLTGTLVKSTGGSFYFRPDGVSHDIWLSGEPSAFTPDPPTLPTKPLAVIEVDDDSAFAIRTRDDWWRIFGIDNNRPFSNAGLEMFLHSRPWHIVFEGVAP